MVLGMQLSDLRNRGKRTAGTSPDKARAVGAALVLLLLLAPPLALARQPQGSLLEQDPYDELTLDAANKNAVLKIEPVDLPGRRLPSNPRPSSKLRLRLPDRPGEEFEVEWRSIERLRLFEQIVLDESLRLARDGRFDQAFEHLRYVEARDAQYPGLADA